MLNRDGDVIYVGKAVNLKKRVSSYFSSQAHHPKTQALVAQIAAVDVTLTHSETEALLLESQLIKTLHPKYNILLRDDKSYPYIAVSLAHPYPAIMPYRSKKKPNQNGYFGPFPSGLAVKEALNIIQKVFKIRNCRDNFFAARTRPCLQYQIKRCSAPCVELISPEAYQASLRDAIAFLKGQSFALIESLEARMHAASARFAYEEAAMLRDQIQSLRMIQESQGILTLCGDMDSIVMALRDDFVCIQYVSVRNGDVTKSETFFPKMPTVWLDEDSPTRVRTQLLEAFIGFYYLDAPQNIPSQILLDELVDDIPELEAMLKNVSGKICRIKVNPRGRYRRFLAFARQNLMQAVESRLMSRQEMQVRWTALSEVLHLENPVTRMECFDISHTSGQATVAACVVFDEHGPCKKAYRQYRIEGITPGDDYAAMKQALTRRFSTSEQTMPHPDILLMDGGKGQVGIAQTILSDLGLNAIVLLGIAKGPGRKPGLERLILASRAEEFSLPPDSKALHLLQHIRDEAHRFAITAHRKKRQRQSIASSLEAIEGIGAKRRQALLTRFGGIQALAKASCEEIAKVSGIHQDLARRIFAHFHPDSSS